MRSAASQRILIVLVVVLHLLFFGTGTTARPGVLDPLLEGIQSHIPVWLKILNLVGSCIGLILLVHLPRDSRLITPILGVVVAGSVLDVTSLRTVGNWDNLFWVTMAYCFAVVVIRRIKKEGIAVASQ